MCVCMCVCVLNIGLCMYMLILNHVYQIDKIAKGILIFDKLMLSLCCVIKNFAY